MVESLTVGQTFQLRLETRLISSIFCKNYTVPLTALETTFSPL